MTFLALLVSAWTIIGQGKADGRFTVAVASGTAIRPAAIQFSVTASPNIRTVAGYEIRCRKRRRTTKQITGKTTALTPITKAIPLPLAHPDVCAVVAHATLPTATRMTVTIRARR